MRKLQRTYSNSAIADRLRRHGINPTSQRNLITRVLFERCTHLSAEDLYRIVNENDRKVSKATVYNTLGLLVEHGIIREVIADPNKVFYDPNTEPHYHMYDVVSGKLTDIDAKDVKVSGPPDLPENTVVEGVDVIFRLRPQD
jgi:Fur family iron response transcriptional regulator